MIVIDQEALRTTAKLHFDEKGKLLWIERNWTPASDHSDEFVKALYNLVLQDQRTFGHCVIVAAREAEPQSQTDEVGLGCQRGGIRITHSEVETGKGEAGKGKVSIVYLWEVVDRPE